MSTETDLPSPNSWSYRLRQTDTCHLQFLSIPLFCNGGCYSLIIDSFEIFIPV